jgi:anti-sigma factor RsiW
MNHSLMKEKIYLLPDTDLPDQEKEELLAHLQVCRECRHSLAEWRNISPALKEINLVPESPYFLQKTMLKINTGAKPSNTNFLSLISLSSVFVVLFLLWSYLGQNNDFVSADDLMAENSRDGAISLLSHLDSINDDELLAYTLEGQ